jgi:hypothetical protein
MSAAADPFRHEALLYAGDDELVSSVSAFVRDGRAAGEPTLVLVGARKLDLLREELGDEADGAHFADIAAVGRNPARIIPAWQTFVARNAGPGVRLRGVGEPIFPERSPQELVEAHRHEALLNLAFLDTTSFWLVCPYDVEALPEVVIEEARRTHPLVAHRDLHGPSDHYRGIEAISAPFDAPLPPRPAGARELRFSGATLDELPRLVAEQAATAGLSVERRIDLVVAVTELARQSGEGSVALWRDGRSLVCELRGRWPLDGPLDDRLLPQAGSTRVGLWMANQLCDLVQVRSGPEGITARLHLPAE